MLSIVKPNKKQLVYQFKITLKHIEPMIWRRIQVPSKYSFWDLHVGIQDAMGWLDSHLHVFRMRRKHKSNITEIGIPDDFDDHVVLSGWETPINTYFGEPGEIALYEYDFGDCWEHEILLEGILLKEKGVKYPKCLDGQRSCPPEDCGGPPGYDRILEIISNPNDEEYQETIEWANCQTRYSPYNPDAFSPEKVIFDNPNKRWKTAFSEGI